ncbi:MAG: ABC transporter ATP-binding protein [Pseudomonadota bacterium]
MTKPILEVVDVSAGYKNKRVIDSISFEIQEGEIFGLIGLNGAGKTTLIKNILGLRSPDEGKINHYGKENISFLPERFAPPWFLSGFQFLQFSQRLYKKTISLEEAQEAAQLISLDPDALKRDVKTYSKGMRQKLGLLATIKSDSKLLILDEPMSGLDPKARQEIKKLIKNAKQKKQSVLMSSHILSDVSELCDKVAVIHQGIRLFLGTPDQMKKQGGNDNLEEAFLNLISKKVA